MHRSDEESNIQQKVDLLIAYFSSGRTELISRVGQRDNALLLFLAASTAVFGVAFGNVSRPALLFAIAPLGLGASHPCSAQRRHRRSWRVLWDRGR
jgi:hypothetical protein